MSVAVFQIDEPIDEMPPTNPEAGVPTSLAVRSSFAASVVGAAAGSAARTFGFTEPMCVSLSSLRTT
jgi:hypothetical protein